MQTIAKPSIPSRRVTAIDQGLSLADQMKLTGSRADVTLYFDIVVRTASRLPKLSTDACQLLPTIYRTLSESSATATYLIIETYAT